MTDTTATAPVTPAATFALDASELTALKARVRTPKPTPYDEIVAGLVAGADPIGTPIPDGVDANVIVNDLNRAAKNQGKKLKVWKRPNGTAANPTPFVAFQLKEAEPTPAA